MDIVRELDSCNILRHFSTAEIKEMVVDQITSIDGICMGSDDSKDYFGSLYYEYTQVYREENLDPDDRNYLIDRFQQVCLIIIEAISDKFDIEVDVDTYASRIEELAAITMILYDFFVLNLHTHLKHILLNYIIENSKSLNETFSEYANKKDASTMANKRYLDPEFALICSNIADIVTWIISNEMDNDTIFKYMDREYAFYDQLLDLFETNRVTGDFGIHIANLYTNSLYLSGFINFEIVAELKARYDLINQ